MKQVSLQSLLLLVTCIAIATAWWIQSSKPSEIYYLHIFSEAYHPLHKEVFRHHTATIGVSLGTPFHGNFTQYDFPVTVVHGIVERQGHQFACTLNLLVDETSTVDSFSKTKIVPLDTPVGFSHSHLVILSRTIDPDQLEMAPE